MAILYRPWGNWGWIYGWCGSTWRSWTLTNVQSHAGPSLPVPATSMQHSSAGGLTPSLPWCQLKMTNKIEKCQTLTPFLFFFALACERIFIKMHSTESRCVIGPENILYGCAPVHLLARILYWHLMSPQMELWVFAPNIAQNLTQKLCSKWLYVALDAFKTGSFWRWTCKTWQKLSEEL